MAFAACARRGKQPAASLASRKTSGRCAARAGDLVGDPHRPGVLPGVPIADGLQGDRSAVGHVFQESLDGTGLVVDPDLVAELPILIENSELQIATMGVATHSIMRHSCTSFACALTRHECSGRCSAFI
jgi:hypothetical protein